MEVRNRQPTKLRVLSPEPAIHWVTPGRLAPRHDSLQGKRIGILRYTPPSKSMHEAALLTHVRLRSQASHVTELFKESLAPWPQEKLVEVAKNVDAVI